MPGKYFNIGKVLYLDLDPDKEPGDETKQVIEIRPYPSELGAETAAMNNNRDVQGWADGLSTDKKKDINRQAYARQKQRKRRI